MKFAILTICLIIAGFFFGRFLSKNICQNKPNPIICDTLELPVDKYLYKVEIKANKEINQILVKILQAEDISKDYQEYYKNFETIK